MPGFDKTGPMGQGPRTGGGFGLCTGVVKTMDSAAGPFGELRGVGRGGRPWGGGRGRCFGGGRGGFGRRGFAGRYFYNREADSNATLAKQMARLIKDNEELRARLAELEAQQR